MTSSYKNHLTKTDTSYVLQPTNVLTNVDPSLRNQSEPLDLLTRKLERYTNYGPRIVSIWRYISEDWNPFPIVIIFFFKVSKVFVIDDYPLKV